MRANWVVTCGAALLCALAMAPGGGGSGFSPEPASEISGLKAQIESLSARVNSLEERCARLDSNVKRLEKERPPPQTVPPSPWPGADGLGSPQFNPRNGGTKPEIWGEREINGWTFYVVPCAQPVSGPGPRESLNPR